MLLLAVLLAIWGSFLVPLRIAGVLAPVSWVIAGVGNAVLVVAAARLVGRLPALVPALLWFVVAATLGNPRPEGDLIVQNTVAGLGFLAAGTLSSVAAFVVASAQRSAPPTPADRATGRHDRGDPAERQ